MNLKLYMVFILVSTPILSFAQNPQVINTIIDTKDEFTIFDDKMLLDGYTKKYKNLSKEIIIEMLKDDTINSYRLAATVRTLKERFISEMFTREKIITEKVLLRRLSRDDSPFVQVEIMDTLCRMDRYRYFDSMVPILIQKIDHYNQAVSEIAFNGLNAIIETGNNRPREARIIFETIRKVLFLSRKRLQNVSEPGPKLKDKLILLRWSVKVLGTQELKKLPSEVLNLL